MGDREFHFEDEWDEPPRIFFGGVELLHLAASVVVLTLAFSLVFDRASRDVPLFATSGDLAPHWDNVLSLAPYAAIAVVPAFILHEIAHKIVAQRKDMWAEFRANPFGLVGGLILTSLTGFLFAVPGAVHIVGNADRRDSGIISIVGPIVNLALGYGAFLLDPLFPNFEIGTFGRFFQLVAVLNGILAAFNMLPIGPLDGRKVWRWSKVGFFGVWALVVALFLLVLH